MDILDLPMTIILVVWILGIIKIGYDSAKLRNLYATQIDSTLPMSASEIGVSISSQIKQIKKSLSMIFAKYPNHPEIEKYAKRVRYDFSFLVIMLAVFVITSVTLV